MAGQPGSPTRAEYMSRAGSEGLGGNLMGPCGVCVSYPACAVFGSPATKLHSIRAKLCGAGVPVTRCSTASRRGELQVFDFQLHVHEPVELVERGLEGEVDGRAG